MTRRLFNPVQPHYTARPVFEAMLDPLPRRSGFRRGLDHLVTIEIPERLAPSAEGGTDGLYGARGFEQHLAKIGTAAGFRPPIVRAVASYVAEHGTAGLDREALKARLRLAIASAEPGHRSADEIARYSSNEHLDEILEWVIQREASKPDASRTALPPYFPGPTGDRDASLALQRSVIAGWFERGVRRASALHEVDRRRQAAIDNEELDSAWAALDTDLPHLRARKAAITRRVHHEVAAEFGYGKIPGVGERLLLSGTQGSGKSRSAAEQVARLRDSLCVWWLVPTLENAAEQAANYRARAAAESPPVLVLRGRAAPDFRDDSVFMCPRHEIVTKAAGAGVNVRGQICRVCPLRNACGYRAQERLIEDLAGRAALFLMARDYAFLPCPAPRPDLVIVDEDIAMIAVRIVHLAPERLLDTGAWRKAADAADWLLVAAVLQRAIVDNRGRAIAYIREAGITREDLEQALSYLRKAGRQIIEDITETMSDSDIAKRLETLETLELHKAEVLVGQVLREWDTSRPGLNTVSLIQATETRPAQIEIAYLRTPLIASTTPVLALDGTGSLLLNRKIWGARMEEQRIAVERDAEVVQVRSKAFSRQSITGCDPRGNTRNDKSVAEAAQLRREIADVLVCLPGASKFMAASKQAEQALAPLLSGKAVTGHFGALRGINRYEECETAVVVGREQVSAEALERLARAFTGDDTEPFVAHGCYVPQSRVRRMRDGSKAVATVQVHPDPRCQAVLEQIREAEIVQAVDRVRPIFNPRTVYLLTDIVVDITVDRMVRWNDLTEVSRFQQAFNKTGRTVALLTDTELARCFPDQWRSPDAVKKERQRRGLRGDRSLIEYLFGKCPPLAANYRRPGQPGSPSRAALARGVADARAALEAVVGPVACFELLHDEEPADRADEVRQWQHGIVTR